MKKKKRKKTMPPEEDNLEAKLAGLKAQIDSLNAKVESFSEIRKATTERFSQVNEMMGEVRGMTNELSKNVSKIEVIATKAVDKVEAVQPDLLLLEVRKVDAKVEALKANIESNETMMTQLFEQLKQMRNQISEFKGVDAIVKLSQDVKVDLNNAMKAQATIERHSDKVESIFMEFQKEFQEFNQLTSKFKGMESDVSRLWKQVDLVKMKDEEKSNRKEVENLVDRINKFEGHVSNTLTLITKKSDKLEELFTKEVKNLNNKINDTFQKKMNQMDLIIKKVDDLIKNHPEISKLLGYQKQE